MIDSVIKNRPFRFWCQKVLPLVYDDSLSYYELLCKVVDYINGLLTDDENVINMVNELEQYVHDYFTNLDVQTEINNKLDQMTADGTLTEIIAEYVDPSINNLQSTIDAFIASSNERIGTQDSLITELSARMDGFSNLPSGSSAIDSEVADGRVSVNGETYTNIGGNIRYAENMIQKYNVYDFVEASNRAGQTRTTFGVTWTFLDSNTVRGSGTATNTSFIAVKDSRNSLPVGIKAGEPVYLEMSRTDSDIYCDMYVYNSSATQIGYHAFNESEWYTLPEDTNGIYLRVRTDSGKTVDGTLTVKLFNKYYEPTVSKYDATENLKVHNTYDIVDTLERAGYERNYNGINFLFNDNSNVQVSGTATGLAWCAILDTRTELPAGIKVGDTVLFKLKCENENLTGTVYFYDLNGDQIYNKSFRRDTVLKIPEECVGFYYRIQVQNGVSINAVAEVGIDTAFTTQSLTRMAMQSAPLNILVLGNSYSYCELEYVASLIKEKYPDVVFNMGILYTSGQTLEGHLNNLRDGIPYQQYSLYRSTSDRWSTDPNVLSSEVLTQLKYGAPWDVVILQQGSAASYNYTRYYKPFLEQLIALIQTTVQKPVNILFNMNHAWGIQDYRVLGGTITQEEMYNGIVSAMQSVLSENTVADIIPCGTAVQNARTTSLDSLGATGDLCYDDRSHLQNGIPYLIPAYTAFYKICEVCGLTPAILGSKLSPTQNWLYDINAFTQQSHGAPTGVSEDNLVIAQKCALWAIKKPFETTDCSAL